jgi:hypothetical protein
MDVLVSRQGVIGRVMDVLVSRQGDDGKSDGCMSGRVGRYVG